MQIKWAQTNLILIGVNFNLIYMKIKYSLSTLILGILLFFAASSNAQNIGFSGMEKLNKSSFLFVIDKKSHEEGNRLGIIRIDDNMGYTTCEIKVNNWMHEDGPARDLESVCALPNKKNEFLLVESSYWNGKFGRIFHVKVNKNKVDVLNTYQIPKIESGNKSKTDGYNFEGVACVANNDDLFIILGERGGSEKFIDGLLRIGWLKNGKNVIDWDTYDEHLINVKAPNIQYKNRITRSITDLYLDKEGVLFASAAVDIGDTGPFSSMVYEIGTILFNNNRLHIAVSQNKTPLYIVDGFKIEALSSCPEIIKNGKFSFGTEDENYLGVWRPLFK